MERSNRRLILGLVGCGAVLLVAICGLGTLGAWWTLETKAPSEPPTGPPSRPPRPPPAKPAPRPDAGGSGTDPPGARVVYADVTNVRGARPVSVGTSCGFTVERRRRAGGGHWCRTQVVCGGRLLYGGPRAGYFPCTLSDDPEPRVVGADDETTRLDGDAAFRVDTVNRKVTLRDDAAGEHGAYSLRARVTRVK